jgi:hypothetical protein
VAWRGGGGARGLADFGRPAAAENPVGQRTGAPRKAVVREDDSGGGGGGHDGDDGGGSGRKKWLSAGGGGSLLLYIDTPLVPGRVTNRDKRGGLLSRLMIPPGLKGDFARESQNGKFPSLVPGDLGPETKDPHFVSGRHTTRD